MIITLSSLKAQTSVEITGNGTFGPFTPGEYTFSLPAGCSAKVTYQAWGGGGSGGEEKKNAVSGGGSGAYINCSTPITIGCGGTYTSTVGAGGAAIGANGEATVVNFGTQNTARGGLIGGNGQGGTGGLATGCDVALNGAEGGKRADDGGGPGANAPNGGLGGAGGPDGSSISTVPAGFGDGTDGMTPGGGGGGHGLGTNDVFYTSGKGGDGQLIVVVTDYQCIAASAGADQIICSGEMATLVGSATMGTPDYTYGWSNGDGTASIMVSAANTYTLTVTDANGCSATDDVLVTVTPLTNAGTDGSLSICAGTIVTAADLFAQLGGTPTAGGVWSPILAGADTYTYTVTGTAPCPNATAQVTVTEQAAPVAGTDGALTICAGTTVTAADLFAQLGGTPTAGGVWSPILAGADTYTYTIAGTGSCPNATAQVVVTEQAALDAGTDGALTICAGTTVMATDLFAQLGGTPAVGGVWSPILAGADTYTYTVTGTGPCPSATAQVVVTEQAALDAGTDGTLTICAGTTVTAAALFAELGGTPATSGAWTPTLAGAGTYTYTVAGTAACPDATATVIVSEMACAVMSTAVINDPSIYDPCSCGNDLNIRDANQEVLLFADFVLISGAATGDTWVLSSVNTGDVLNASGNPIGVNTVLTDLGGGLHRLDFFHNPNVGFNATFTGTRNDGTVYTSSLTTGGSCSPCPLIPTMSQWGLLIFGLLILNLSHVLISEKRAIEKIVG